MVLVDTSVWIDFLRQGASPESRVLEQLIKTEQDIAICGLIRQEILQGIRDDLTLRRVRGLLNETFYLRLEEPDSFDEAAEIYRKIRRHGHNLRSPADCLIASLAIRFRISLLHRDRDFITIARFTDLALH